MHILVYNGLKEHVQLGKVVGSKIVVIVQSLGLLTKWAGRLVDVFVLD
jgi:hypothetical protein